MGKTPRSMTRFAAACVAEAARINRRARWEWIGVRFGARAKPLATSLAAALFVAIGAALALSPGAARAEEPARLTLVALGDSLTAGFGLPAEDGFAPQLEAWMREQGVEDVTVVNAGVSGDTTSGGLARLDWSVGPEADAVILELGANDMLRGVDPALARANLDEMLARLGARGVPVLLAGVPSLANFGDEYKAAFDAIFPELGEKYGVPVISFFPSGLTEQTDLFLPNDFHPNARGVRAIVEHLGPAALELAAQAREAS